MDKKLSKQLLVDFLTKHVAHMTLDEAVKDFPKDMINSNPPNVEYSFWQLLEHVRITQWDILDFMKNPKYKYMSWPKDYWPTKTAKTDWKGWQKTIKLFNNDLAEIVKIVKDPKTDFYSPILWGEGQNVIREILLIVDHNSYHIGEFSILRQVVNNWETKS